MYVPISPLQLSVYMQPPTIAILLPTPTPLSTLKGTEGKRKKTNQPSQQPRGRLSAYSGLEDRQIIIYRPPKKKLIPDREQEM